MSENEKTGLVRDPGTKRGDSLKTPGLGVAVILTLVFLGWARSFDISNPCRNLAGSTHTLSYESRAYRILADNPLIDGHNDLLIKIREKYAHHIYARNFTGPFQDGTFPGQVDLKRMKSGHYAGAFWSAFYLCPADIHDFSDAAYAPIVIATLQQLELYNRLAAEHPEAFPTAPTSDPKSALSHFDADKLISPLAIEGLHQIGNSMANLRLYHTLGVRYSTLTWNCHNKYADAAVHAYVANGTSVAAPPHWGGISKAGRGAIREMNRLGMLVDLAHVSKDTMRDVLVGEHNFDAPHNDISQDESEAWTGSHAPPIISHSSAYALCPHPRNIPDDILPLVKKRNSIVMINFNPDFISCTAPPSDAPSDTLPTPYKANATLGQVVKHIMYVGERIGYEYVGIGSDFDGIEDVPLGLEDVSKIPMLVAELLRQGVTDEQAALVVGRNVLRVWVEAERVGREMRERGVLPLEDENPGWPGVGLPSDSG